MRDSNLSTNRIILISKPGSILSIFILRNSSAILSLVWPLKSSIRIVNNFDFVIVYYKQIYDLISGKSNKRIFS